MSDLLLGLLIIGLHGYWVYKLVTYDWSQYDEDQKQLDEDFF
mgnify:CR=1 FL=1